MNEERSSGGVAIKVLRTLKHEPLPALNLKIIEAIGIEIKISNNSSIQVWSIYLPNGDFNSKHRMWNCVRANAAGNILYNLQSIRHFFVRFPDSPTRFPSNSTTLPSTIDLLLTNGLHDTTEMETFTSNSDHVMIVYDISLNENPLKNDPTLVPLFRKANWDNGGQQRRVSFAVALMHDPELLILDEPTVGVDPLLRQSIWNHLVHITKTGQKTVIITTHYIEEARQAHTIGLMRSGRLLAEESPQVLLSMYRCQNLEDVFLKLSRKQGQSVTPSELNISNNISLSALAFGNKKDNPVYVSQESGVINDPESNQSNGINNVHCDECSNCNGCLNVILIL
uniref:CSON007168 protein n=1 Tax=Culicoides sonorensis TaxID=179676 RepID=A0A336LJ08_CULSO